MNKLLLLFILLNAVTLPVYAQAFEKMVLGKNINIPIIGDEYLPVCEENKQVREYLNNIMAKPGLSELITCFFKNGIGNSKYEHVYSIISHAELGEKNINQETFLRIKKRIIYNVENRADQFLEESREDSVSKGFPVSDEKNKSDVLIVKDTDKYAIFLYKTKAPLQSAGKEVEKTNVMAIIKVKGRIIYLKSYAYEIDLPTQNIITLTAESWIKELLKINS